MKWFWVTKEELSVVKCDLESLRMDNAVLRDKVMKLRYELDNAIDTLGQLRTNDVGIGVHLERITRDLQVRKDEAFILNGKDMAWYKENTDKLLQWKEEVTSSKPVYPSRPLVYSSGQQGPPPRGSKVGRRKFGKKA